MVAGAHEGWKEKRAARASAGGRVRSAAVHRGMGIRALQILFVREPASRNRLRGVGALLRATFAVRRMFSGVWEGGERDEGVSRGESSARSLQGVDGRSDRLASGHEPLR